MLSPRPPRLRVSLLIVRHRPSGGVAGSLGFEETIVKLEFASLVMGLSALLAACGTAASRNAGPRVRDSAGIQIVENDAPSGPAPFTIDSLPDVDIGRDTADQHQLFVSNLVSAHVLTDGRVVAAGWATKEIRVFDSTGTFLRTIGREGAGPGEFEVLGWMYVGAGDTLYTFEPSARRVQAFASDGTFLRFGIVTSPRIGGFPYSQGVFANGSLLMAAQPPSSVPRSPGVFRKVANLYRYRWSGGDLDSLGTAQMEERILEPGKNGLTEYLPFGRTTLLAVAGSRMYVAPTDNFEVSVRNAEGLPIRLIRRSIENQPVTKADGDAVIAARVKMGGAVYGEQIRRSLTSVSLPSTKPACQNLVVTADGSIWVEHYNEPARGPTVVSVFDSTGALRGEVSLPVGFSLLQVGNGFVLGTWKDGDDALHIRRHRLRARL